MSLKASVAALVAAVGIAAAGGLAYAKTGMNGEAADLARAQITLEQAVAAAQQHHSGGLATKAELESRRGSVFYEVEVVTADNQVFDVRIDAVDGKVLSSRMDRSHDRHGDHD